MVDNGEQTARGAPHDVDGATCETGPMALVQPSSRTIQQLGSSMEVMDDVVALNEQFHARGWTDGLPVMPPTPDAVAACLDWGGWHPDQLIGIETVRERPITAEKLAVNAVMAGCLPPHFPVVVAAVEAMCQQPFLLHGATSSTGGCAVLVIVNGPIRVELDMVSGHNALGNDNRSAAVIGRAIRLILINVLDCRPGQLDRSTLGHPGKFSYCVAEDEEGTPWTPLAQDRGVRPGNSAVTVFAAGAPRQIMNEWTTEPTEILETFAAEMRANMLDYSIWAGNYVMVVPKQLRDRLSEAGWDKTKLREHLYERTVVTRGDWERVGKGAVVDDSNRDDEYRALRGPEDLLVVAAGGPAGGFGAVIPPWFGYKSQAVTTAIGVCDTC